MVACLGRGKGGVSVAVAAETLEGLPGGGMKLVPSQARWKKGDASFSKGSGQKNDLFEGSEWCFGRLMVGWPSQPFHLG